MIHKKQTWELAAHPYTAQHLHTQLNCKFDNIRPLANALLITVSNCGIINYEFVGIS